MTLITRLMVFIQMPYKHLEFASGKQIKFETEWQLVQNLKSFGFSGTS